jgi:hypothetical protein
MLVVLMLGLFLVFWAIGSETSAFMTMTAQRATSTFIVLAITLSLRSIDGLRKGDTPASSRWAY